MKKEPELFWLSQYLLEISWKEGISEDTLLKMIAIKAYLWEQLSSELREIRMGYHRMALHFKESVSPSVGLNHIAWMIENAETVTAPPRKRWYIPVCYSPEVAKDIVPLTHSKGISVEELVQEHSQREYVLFFYGFLPGFMYLGGLSERLYSPRKSVPDPVIEAGSVAIGGQQTGIYPMDSPGGWHVIGMTPFRLFDSIQKQMPPFLPGDRIRFRPISPEDYHELKGNTELKLSHEVI
jgi:KipI family sensor histidine kinase inhibitor